MTATVPASAIARQPEGATPPISFAQERMWFVEQLQPGTSAYVVPVAVRLRGPLEVRALRLALADVAARHDSLRMCFPSSHDGRARVHVEESVGIPLRVVELSAGTSPAAGNGSIMAAPGRDGIARERRAREILRADIGPFDLTSAPLMRATLVRLGDDDHVLQLVLHHIITDGWSRPLLLEDLAACYTARLGLGPVPEPPPVGYVDYAAWQQELMGGAQAQRDVAWWCEELTGVPALDLPVDRPRPAELTTAAGFVGVRVGTNLLADLTELGRAHRASLFVTMLAALHATLHRWSGQRDFAVGSPVAGRERPELERVVGLFVNILPLRAIVDPAAPFSDLLATTRERVLDALSHQDVPFERVVQELNIDRDTSRTPVFQVLFSMHNATGEGSVWPDGLRAAIFGHTIEHSKQDLSIFVDERDTGLSLELFSRNDLFDEQSMDRFVQAYRRVLAAVARDPHVLVGDLELTDELERLSVLDWGTGAPAAHPDLSRVTFDGAAPVPGSLLCDVIDAHVATTPAAVAVVSGAETLTYAELADDANRVANWVRERGVEPVSVVGVCLSQSASLAAVLLGIGRAGCAYLPLDAEQPASRLALILNDARPALVIADDDVASRSFPHEIAVVAWDTARQGIGAQPAGRPPVRVSPLDLAYVIYTSGSTGTPKGVGVAHRQIRRYLEGVAGRFAVTPAARWALPQSLSFDFAVTVFYLALATGGAVHLVPRRSTGEELAQYLREHRIDYLKMTPSHLAALASEVDVADLVPARAVILGGEASRLDWAAALASRGATVFNHYGPTETTVGVATFVVPTDGGAGQTPVGAPLPDARVYVLDDRLRPAPVGVAGEIHIGGDRLARGYLGRPGLTARSFRPDPFTDTPGARMYATGDLGRWRADGQLEFLGRRDGQVKLRGYRVELGEVEASLLRCPGASAAVAVLREDRLVGYLQRTPGEPDLDTATLRDLLAQWLPEYMIPNAFVWLDRLPLQEHGKVDRRALPAPTTVSTVEHVEPVGPVEATIARVWTQVLGVARVGALDDFFVLGGHSLLATQVVALLRRELPDGASLTVMDLFRFRTVRAMARLFAQGGSQDRLLHELSRPGGDTPVRSYVCVPYGGANAVVYQPLADAMPDGHRLFAVAVPGHDIGRTEQVQPLEQTAQACVDEILSSVPGPLVVYGHCGPGGALAVEIARRLEESGRELEAVYLGGIFPFARPVGGIFGRLFRLRLAERLRGDRVHANWLQGMGADLGALDEEQRRFLIRAMRHDARLAEEYFTGLLHRQVAPLRAPVISVVGERDPGTEFYQERYREWGFLSGTTALVVLEEGGHYFSRFRAPELADIITDVDGRLDQPAPGRDPEASWSLAAIAHTEQGETTGTGDRRAQPALVSQPRMKRFAAVAAGQLLSATGSALTEFAVPLWIYLQTGSLLKFALFAVLAQVPGILAAPVAGAWIDRTDKRRAMLTGDIASGVAIGVFATLFWTGALTDWHAYTLVGVLSVALTYQRLAYLAAVPQLVPKRYLGHASGAVQLSGGIAQFLVPLVAVGLVATIGLGGILLIDLVSYVFAIATVALVRFPATMAWKRRESLMSEIVGGLRYTVRHPGFRAMVLFFAVFNLFLAPMFLLLSPLVLAFAELGDVARVSLAGGVGAVLGGLAMLMWGGPRHRRMTGMLVACLAFGVAGVLTGLRASVAVVAVGALAMSFTLAIVNGVWLTIIQTKVPQRLHARVIALNMVIALSTMPIGQALLTPLLVPAVEPLLAHDGALAGTVVGSVLGLGPGRGIGLLYVVFGLLVVVTVAVGLVVPRLARFDDEVPDAPPDDLVGLRSFQQRTGRTPSAVVDSPRATAAAVPDTA